MYAASCSQEATCSLLLSLKADPNILDKNGATGLHMAAYLGHPTICQILLENGADLRIQNKDGWTALHVAVHHNQTEVAEVLLKFPGSDLLAKTKDGKTVLALAKGKRADHLIESLRQRWSAFCAGKHHRAGKDSPVLWLVDDVLRIVHTHVWADLPQ
eukprot:c9609_g1_i7.p1 GENE.c9609_g1_i7~~c9609_g1_i7.p1  ORF type:complete len:158 (+),score=25.13 c9609_g1_i7:360-833(+)